MLVHVLMQTYYTVLFRDIKMVIIVAWIFFMCTELSARDCTCSRAIPTRYRSWDIENTGYYQVEICFCRIRRQECTCSRVHILLVACHGTLKIVNIITWRFTRAEFNVGSARARVYKFYALSVMGH